MEAYNRKGIVCMQQFNRYQDDNATRTQIILAKAFKISRCDKVVEEFKKLLQKI